MDKKTQDLSWACLPKEVREEIRKRYKGWSESLSFEMEIILYDDLFGHHNLTSDTESAELLYVERKKVQEMYKQGIQKTTELHIPKDYSATCRVLDQLFGDKCLPDNDPSVQVEPKFRKGDKVRFKDSYYKEELHGKVGIIAFVNMESECYVVVDNTIYCARESDLEPYVEPKFKVGDKVIHNHKNREVGEVAAYSPDEKFCYSVRFGKEYHNMAEHQLEPYSEPESRNLSQEIANCDKSEDNQLKDNMEEKELNLCELLKDCIGDTFFHPRYGDVELIEVTESYIELSIIDGGTINIPAKGCLYPTGMAFLYPDAETMKKYPFDGKVAWREWASERKPKRWTPKNGEKFWHLNEFMNGVSSFYNEDDFDDYTMVNKSDNCFQTYELCQQAAEAVRECLERFHKEHQ